MRKLLRNRVRFLFVSLVTVGLVMMNAAHSTSATRHWRNNAGNGNWNDPAKWSSVSAADVNPANNGVPVAGEPVNIVNTDGTSHTVTYNVNAPAIGLLTINQTGGGAATNTLSIPSNNSLSANGIFVGGYTGGGPTTGRGAINQTAGTVTINPGTDFVLGHGAGSTGTYTLGGTGALVANQTQFIGYSGTGVFNHSAGTNTINASAVGSLVLGYVAGASGTYNLSGTGNLTSNENVYIGYDGTGTLNQTGGSHTIQGASSDLYVGFGGTGTYQQSGGTFHTNSDVYVGGTPGAVGNIIVNGPGSSFTSDGLLYVGNGPAAGSLVVSGGATVANLGPSSGVGLINGSSGYALITDPGSNWQVANDLFVGIGGSGDIDIQNQGLLFVGQELIIGSTGSVNLHGGTLRVNSISGDAGISNLNYSSGTIQLGGNRAIGGSSGDTIINSLFGPVPVITLGNGLSIEGTATLHNRITLDGGTFTAPTIVNGHNLSLQGGQLNITNQAVTIGAGGLLGSTLDLNDDMTININQGITNQGLVTGDGQIGGTFTNVAAGELRAEPGKSLKLTGGAFFATNSGRITLYGGMIEFTQNLINNAGGFISGNGTLKTSNLTNSGTMNFAGTANILGSVTNAVGGKVISGGGGATIFYNDVINNGEIRTSTNGFTVFFGSVSGSGTFTGTGTVNFEGDLSPGSSPAAVNFAGDVVLGAEATLEIQLGGITAGTQHDKLNVTGDLALDGALEVSLISGFIPSAGQSFNILDWGSLAGTFSSVALPTLSGLAWNTSQLYTTGVLSVAAAPGLPGDFNNDGKVDAADYVVWRKNPVGIYTQADFNTWRANFGNTAGSGSVDTASVADSAVPEPASLAFLLFAAAALFVMRRPAQV